MSLIVVITAPPARLLGIPFSQVIPHWTIAVNLLAGSLIGCLAGCELGDPDALDDPVSGPRGALLVLIAGTLVATHLGHTGSMNLSAPLRITAGVTAGVLIGIVAALMGVAGGELLIPTIVLLFAVDIKIAGSLSLAVSLPTMLVAFARYSRDQSFVVLRHNTRFLVIMAARIDHRNDHRRTAPGQHPDLGPHPAPGRAAHHLRVPSMAAHLDQLPEPQRSPATAKTGWGQITPSQWGRFTLTQPHLWPPSA